MKKEEKNTWKLLNKSMDHIILPLTLLMLEAVGCNMHMDWVIKVADIKSEVI